MKTSHWSHADDDHLRKPAPSSRTPIAAHVPPASSLWCPTSQVRCDSPVRSPVAIVLLISSCLPRRWTPTLASSSMQREFQIWTAWLLYSPDPKALALLGLSFYFLLYLVSATMPSVLSSSPFLSLRPDHDCGRHKDETSGTAGPAAFASLNGHRANGINGAPVDGTNNPDRTKSGADGYTNGQSHGSTPSDEFLKLDQPQQDLLLLHGPRQKYSLEHSKEIPELRKDEEILIQVLAIGLNSVDWKGADYGFSQPSYPWFNGRDLAGIVVRGPREPSRIQQGDVVFGPSTDYRAVRKVAYQEYVVTTDYNVARIPSGTSAKEEAALGVAFVAAAISLGVSFGVDFSSLRTAPNGPNFLPSVRSLDPRDVPEDVRDEVFGGISHAERPQPGEWLAIWGANSMTGQMALQLAKHAGLRVACVADLAKGGSRLAELGADFMADKFNPTRAVEILRAVTGGKLRFGFDCNGSDSAAYLQEAVQQSSTGMQSHILGLTGCQRRWQMVSCITGSPSSCSMKLRASARTCLNGSKNFSWQRASSYPKSTSQMGVWRVSMPPSTVSAPAPWGGNVLSYPSARTRFLHRPPCKPPAHPR